MRRWSGGLKIFKININLTNRWLYTLVLLGVFLTAGIFVYASSPSADYPNPGHEISEFQTCDTENDILQVGSDGKWNCTSFSSAYAATVTATPVPIGTLIDGDWCTASGGQVVCTSSPPVTQTKGSRVYTITAVGCNNQGTLTTSDSCTTAFLPCDPYSGYSGYIACDGTYICAGSPQTCSNTPAGYLVS